MQIQIAANKSCINKTNPQQTANGWRNHQVDIPWLLEWVKQGYGWCACFFIDRYRKGDNVCWKNGTNLVVVDFDGDARLEQFWETQTARDWCAATYTSSSHSHEQHRFRALFPLAKLLHSEAEHRGAYWLVVNRLAQELGLAELKDNCGQKPERLWYGNTRTQTQLNDGAEIPEFLLNDIAQDDAPTFKADSTASDVDIQRCQWLLENFLEPSSDGEYESYFTPVMAACASVGEQLWDAWLTWVDRGHHGQKEANRQPSKWQGLGTHFSKLYSLAKKQDPGWKNKLPKELQYVSPGAQKGYAAADALPDYSKAEKEMGEMNFIKTAVETVVADVPDDVDVDSMPGAPKKRRGRPAKSEEEKVDEEVQNVAHVKRLFKNLRRNTLTDQIEYEDADGNVVVISGRRWDTLTTELCCEHRVHIRKELLISAVTYVAMMNDYCPITGYLERCEATAEPSPDWHRIGEVFLGNHLDVATDSLQRLMIGAVARAFNPGCTMSWLPILIGKQGAGKSQFARNLAPESLFSEITTPLSKLMMEPNLLHKSWLIELPEIDQQFKTKNIEPFKNLITTRVDEQRKAYARDSEKMPRQFVFIGTTNVNTLLVDSTGNRRFIPLEIGVKKDDNDSGNLQHTDFAIPWQLLREKRDSLWAAAIKDFRAGKPYEFSSGEIAEMANYQKQFADPDPWEQSILKFIATEEEVTVDQILMDMSGLGFKEKMDKLSRKDSKRVIDVLQANQWRMRKTTKNGKTIRPWVNPNPPEKRPDNNYF